jgi:hypothetical protein
VRNAILTLLTDVRTRRWRGIGVVAITAAIPLLLNYGDTKLPGADTVTPMALLVCVAGIVYLIAKDDPRSRRLSKSAVYSAIIVGTLWIEFFIYACFQPQGTLLKYVVGRAADGTVRSDYFEMAPVIMVSIFGIMLLIAGAIAYAIGRRRKDIKGIKNRDLFK